MVALFASRKVPTRSASDSISAGDALFRKLQRFAAFSDTERAGLDGLVATFEYAPAGQSIVAERETPAHTLILLEGLACRHKDFRDGRRQILAVLTPGDICAGEDWPFAPLDHGVFGLTTVKIARVAANDFVELLERHAPIAAALRTAALVDQAVQRAWTANLGQRNALERAAHLLCELFHRMTDRGLAVADGGFELPLTKHDLGSALGLTEVQVNRVSRRLRAEGLAELQVGAVRILDLTRLQRLADFDPGYLSA